MTYRPRPEGRFEQEQIEAAVSRRIDELLKSVSSVSSLYVEPGDVLLVQVDDEADMRTMSQLQHLLKDIFQENRGLLTPESISFKVLRKSETDGVYYDTEKITSLDKKVLVLEERIKSLEQLINKGENNE